MRMSRVTDDGRRELLPGTSCRRRTVRRCRRHRDKALCSGCECAWIYENNRHEHIVTAPGTPFLRWYMSLWPQELPPPRNKLQARALADVEGLLDQSLDLLAERFAIIWDRDDALLAIAERALRIHARDARVIDAWNEYVEKENAKRRHRRLRGWRNQYYSRAIRPWSGEE